MATEFAALPELEAPPRGRTLYRHPTDKRLGGICGGLGDYFNIDPVLIRLLWILAALATGGVAFLAYCLLWLMLPVGTRQVGRRQPAVVAFSDDNLRRAAWVLIGLGVLWLLANTGILPEVWRGASTVIAVVFWPLLLILAGFLLLRGRGGTVSLRDHLPDAAEVKARAQTLQRRFPLKRVGRGRILLGVCGGLARTLKLDPTVVRILWALFSIGSLGTGVILYALLAVLLPEDSPAAVEVQEIEILDPIR